MRLSRFYSSAGKPELGASGWGFLRPPEQGRHKGAIGGDQQAKDPSLAGAEPGWGRP